MKKLYVAMMLVLVILALISSSACASTSSNGTVPPATTMPAPRPAVVPGMPSPVEQGESANYDNSKGSYAGDGNILEIDRKIVKTGNMTLVVTDIGETMIKISSLANEVDGYVVESNKYETDKGATFGRISIRVPAQKYDDAVARLRQLAIKVPSENTSSQDVTQEYIDLQARLKNLEATEAQYLILLNKAEKVEDILNVQRELSNVREQIEQLKGRIQYIERTSDMSLIEISLQEEKTFQENGWNPLETFKSAVRGLAAFGKVLLDIVIWLVIFIPLWIVIAVIVIVIIVVKRRKARAKSV